MLILKVAKTAEQSHTDLHLAGQVCLTGAEASSFHLDITPIQCKVELPCTSRPRCPGDRPAPEPKADTWTLRYIPDSIEGSALRFGWCDLLWKQPSGQYDAALYREGVLCGRLRIQLDSGILTGADTSAASTCQQD